MAKKRKKDKEKEEEYEFTPPEFDEKEFLKKELRDIRTGLITVVFAIVLGIAAGAVSMIGNNLVIVAFFIGIAGIAILKQFYAFLGIDTSDFKKKNWAGNIATLFFTFLAVWILTINMPFTDHADPTIEEVIVWVNDGTKNLSLQYEYISDSVGWGWVSSDPTNYTEDNLIRSSASYTVNITARVVDNGKLSTVTINVMSGTTTPELNMVNEGKHRFGYSVKGDALGTELTFQINAADSVGNSAIFKPSKAIVVLAP